ncbi:NAD(P)-dependent dehydrogenase (short-subunit alcohol dehydrogenase family) [Agromyces sp. 3263]|uniref:SDR family NAD(P)-dependent oxidoreductase n=1 Tax=Agromyces sp. 3263 TaxID=2817750 RepID=UPI002858E98A|nr:SDR family oxidoreductase [Agromyces sp. 3263]MDR6905071.1 NAD(P)-dependent dehydrogenase (short-subunit alcohol dehydrogenase family) [Agromyces sp. 3263]
MHGIVVVTGGAAGLGAVIAETLLAHGHGVLLIDRDLTAARATADDLEARHGSPVAVVAADLSTIDGIQAAADALAGVSGITALVNNAGGWSPGPQYPDAEPDAWLGALTLDLVAPLLLAQRLWPRLAAVGGAGGGVGASGAVVNIGSSGGEGDEPYGSPEYGAAKAGLRRFTTSLGGRADVRVMAVVPGWIGLDRAHRQFAALTAEQQRATGRLIPPQEVADRVLHLLEHGRPGEVVELLE